MSKQKRKESDTWFDSYKKVRKTWGDVDPRTTIKKSKKDYNRKKEKKKWRDALNEY